MKKVKITTPENIEIEVELAEVLSRSIAAFIDTLIQGCIALAVGWVFFSIISHTLDRTSQEFYGVLLGGLIIIEAVIMYGYYMYQEMKMHGQTIGKKVMHLRVIRDNGSPVTARQVVIRNLFRIFIDNTGIGVMLMFFTKNKKRLGDMASGTMVIVEEHQQRPLPLEEMVEISDEIKSYLSQDEYSLLREYFERKQTMTNYEALRNEMKSYFKEKFDDLGIGENAERFIEKL